MIAPRRRFLALLFVGGLCIHPTVRGEEATGSHPPADLRNLRDLVRTDDGTIWGFVPVPSADSGPYRLENDHWQAVTTVGLPENRRHPQTCRMLCQTRRADGAVICLWENGNEQRIFTVQQGREFKVVATLKFTGAQRGAVENQRLFADSKNNVWYTGDGPEICRLSPDGHADCLHVVQPEECAERGRPRPGRRGSWNTVAAFEDARGQMWFHTEGNVYNDASIRGLLVFDGEHFAFHDLGVPDDASQPRVGALAQKDATHLWITTTEQGLCSLDAATVALDPLPGQPPEVRWTQAIYPRGEDWLFLCGPTVYGHADTLWRLRVGHWDKLIDGVDADPDADLRRHDRPWVRAAAGNFLGGSGSGLWFLPDDGAPVRLDWRRGFPLATPRGLVPLPDGRRWLGVDADGRSWVGSPEALLAGPPPADNPRLRLERAQEKLVADRRRHLWGGFADDPRTLREWDGERWTSHDIPAEVAPPATVYRTLMGVDGLQRIWMRAEWGPSGRMFIYDPAGDRWQSFDEFEQALEAQAPLGRDAEPPFQENVYDLARYGPHGQICYYSRGSKIAWFDGRQWHRWSREEVCGKGVSASVDGPPFFSSDGRLQVNLSHQTYEYAEEGGWRQVREHEPGYADSDVRAAANRSPELPPAAAAREPDSVAMDAEGESWLTSRGELLHCRGALCVTVFQPGEAQPFIDHRRLDGVLIDARGNTFLRTAVRGEYVVLAPPGPPPRTTLALVPAAAGAAADRVEIRLGTDAGPLEGKVRFEWRLDAGAWQSVAAERSPTSFVLDGLPGGVHRFEARSFNTTLQTDPVPAALDLRVNFDPAMQVGGYIAQLADPDDARRKAAVFALARQPDLARTALQAARVKTDDANCRWWIDAALEQIAREKQTAAPAPGKTP